MTMSGRGLSPIDQLEREHLRRPDGGDVAPVGEPLDYGPEPVDV